MKKILFFLLIGSALFMASCTKQYNQVVPNKTYISDQINSSSWTTSDGGKNYSVDINISDLGNGGTAYNGVLVYLTFDNGQSYEALPEVYNNTSFTYTYSPGVITLYAQSSDGTQVIPAPEAFKAKIVLVASN